MRAAAPWLLAAAFFAQGYSFIRRAGVQHDEVLFAGAQYPPFEVLSTIPVGAKSAPLMLDYYLGCVKTWAYKAVLGVMQPTVRGLRLPVVALGALTLVALWVVVSRWAGWRAAAMACALLAFDPVHILTTTYDWGPVALQHLLTIAALGCFVEVYRSGRAWCAFAGGLAAGLAIWDKSLAVWVLGGILLAALVCYWVEIVRRTTGGVLGLALLGLVIGAWPVLYTATANVQALRERAASVPEMRLTDKVYILRATLDGSALFDYLTRSRTEGLTESAPVTSLERGAAVVSAALGHPERHAIALLVPVALAALVMMGAGGERRRLLFVFLAMALGWVAMAATHGGGVGAHHVVLLWPLPQVAVGLGLAHWKRWPAALVAAACLTGAAVSTEYLDRLTRWGNPPLWTQAIHPLRDYLNEARISKVYMLDWGILGPLRFLAAGRIPIEYAADLDPKLFTEHMGPTFYFVARPEELANVKGVRARFRAYAESRGLREVVLEQFRDGQGALQFEAFHYEPAGGVR